MPQFIVDAALPFRKWNTWTLWYIFQDSFILQNNSRISSIVKVCHRFIPSFSSLHLLHFIPAIDALCLYLLILCYNHAYVSLPPQEGCKFSKVLAGTWKLLNKYQVVEQIYIWLLFVSYQSEETKLLN